MAPNVISSPDGECPTKPLEPPEVKHPEYKMEIVWRNVILFAYLHLAALYGMYLFLFHISWKTFVWTYITYMMSALGITAGAHRLWSHKSYKAKLPLRIILVIFNSISFQNDIIEWSRDHRVHHKFSETDADPHNATRGFFFSHVGWLLCRKHPQIREKGKLIDMSDLELDPLLQFQRKYYLILMPLACFIIPTFVPMYFWNETFANALMGCTLFRYAISLNFTWLVNSAAHMWGQQPYDATINPAENLGVALGAAGEGWHNYHHVFPWDYKAAELGNYRANTTTAFIDLMSKIGWAYDLKTVPKEVINKRCQRTGDGSRPVWGWGDKDITFQDKDGTVTLGKTD